MPADDRAAGLGDAGDAGDACESSSITGRDDPFFAATTWGRDDPFFAATTCSVVGHFNYGPH